MRDLVDAAHGRILRLEDCNDYFDNPVGFDELMDMLDAHIERKGIDALYDKYLNDEALTDDQLRELLVTFEAFLLDY